MPFDIKNLINPKLTRNLLEELDESIEKIAKQIDPQTLLDSKDKISKMKFEDDNQEMNNLIDEYLEKIVELMPKQ